MSRISKPVNWEVFNMPLNQPVQYYSIVKKQSDFSRLILQYDTQVFRHGYQHYIGIVPNYLSSSLNNTCEIFIMFLNELPTTSFIGFQVKVSKETFTHESKSLLLFLKNTKKVIFYKLKNNCIHVQCGTNAWELFYLLYDNYLRSYVLSIIGTRFFYNFVYTYCIEKEKQTLRLLYKKSKTIRVSKSSIYYKIHRKRKISVTDLIYMTLNMPKRKKYTLSWFNSKESQLYSDVENGDFSTVAGNKISVSKLLLKKYKQSIVPEKYSKLTFSDSQQVLDSDSLSGHFKIFKSFSTENQWKEYKKFASYTVQNYSTVPFINPLICSLLKNKISCEAESHSLKTNSNIYLPLLTSNSKSNEIKNTTVVEETYASRVHMKNDTSANVQTTIRNLSLDKSKSSDLMTNPGIVLPQNLSSQHSTFPNKGCGNISFLSNLDLAKNSDIKSIHFLSNSKDMNENYSPTDDVNFSTATGKVINITSAAMFKAYKICEKKEMVPEKFISNIVKHEVPERSNKFNLNRKCVKKDACFLNIFKNYSQNTSFCKNNEIMPRKLKAVQSSNTENLKLGNFDASEDVTFSTATGKTINISNTAMEAAQTFIYKSTNDKIVIPSENLLVQRNQFCENKISNSCISKTDDVDMDNTLVEKFFEDVQFDEKEVKLSENDIKRKKLNASFELKNDNLPAYKRRKSLGGRRSMKYCIDKL